MAFSLPTTDEENRTRDLNFNLKPDTCPVCQKAIDPRIKFSYIDKNKTQVVLQCPRNSCRSFFIAHYNWNEAQKINTYSHVKPVEPIEREFSNEISSVSENFCIIYNEAFKAEQIGLTQVAGGGYRKALEFLIKDYAISADPKNKEKIEAKFLSNVISDHVDNQNIEKTAKMASWLGNDETHYTRKWDGMDIEDLKKLIELTVRWVEMEEMTKSYEQKMTAPPPAEEVVGTTTPVED